jgi:hypothetical protein
VTVLPVSVTFQSNGLKISLRSTENQKIVQLIDSSLEKNTGKKFILKHKNYIVSSDIMDISKV